MGIAEREKKPMTCVLVFFHRHDAVQMSVNRLNETN